ncbi:MAG: hypothetical protein U0Y82_11855 [Thermoleophilia bacterium]
MPGPLRHDGDPVWEARREAAPFAIVAALLLAGLALFSWRRHWELDWVPGWLAWGLAAVPQLCVSVALVGNMGHRRTAERLLGLVVAAHVVVSVLLVATMVHPTGGVHVAGGQLLATAGVLWATGVIAFGVLYWEVDDGGPVHRAAMERRQPDFQFPQDENPQLAADGWRPALWDYLYVSFTNSIAFSPTDAMPLTHRAKAVMTLESALSVVAVIVVAARAINILG